MHCRYSDGSSYSVAIVATDGASTTTTMTLTVQISDVKEPPKFRLKKYTLTPREDLTVGSEVRRHSCLKERGG